MSAYRQRTSRWLPLALAAALATPGLAAAAGGTQGFIYGRVTAQSGTVYEGRLRWNGDEEAFWGDFFNASKAKRPYEDEVPGRVLREEREPIRIFGIRIGSRSWSSSGRTLVARFGDIRRIEIHRGDEATLVMKSGMEVEIGGGSNDVDGKIYVWDKELGEVKLDWDRLQTIEFLPAPANLQVTDHRLHGKVKTEIGDFEGYVQWDQEECLSSDKLDGDGPDGDMSIDMGNIRSIERRSRRASQVTLWGGRDFELDGTNDVNDENRGIYVEDARYGRVLIPWSAFERVDFSEAGSSGPSYDDFKPSEPLRGTVTDAGGKRYSGRIVYDIDESETWEILNGEWRDVEYSIPFALVRAVEPRDDESSRVILKSGEELVLEDAADVDGDNSGVLVIPIEGKPIYVEWDDVKRIDFEG